VRGCHLALLWPVAALRLFPRGAPGTDEDPGREAVRRAPASAGPGGRSGGSRRACWSGTRAVLVLLGATSPLDGRPPHWPGAFVVLHIRLAVRPATSVPRHRLVQAPSTLPHRGEVSKALAARPRPTFEAGRALRRNRCSLLPQNAPLASQLCSLWAAPHSHVSDVSSCGAVWQALRTCVTSGRRSTAKS
jgi:hypothetical protein